MKQSMLVKLHTKKGYRELVGGRLPVPGAKVAKARRSDLIPLVVSRPDTDIWLVRSVDPLPAGEYALMIDPQNFYIFPFAVSD